jgi:hypothetical protein
MHGGTAPGTLTVTGRLLHTRFIGVAVVLALAGFIYGGATVAVAIGLRRVELGGVTFDPTDRNLVTASTRPDVHPGDRLVAVAGIRAVPDRLRPLLTEAPAAAEGTTVTFADAGGEHTVPAATAPLPDIHIVGLWARVLSGLFGFLLGLTSFALAPGTPGAWLFFIFCSNLELTLLYNVCFVANDAIWVIGPVTFAFSGSVAFQLFTYVPVPLTGRWLHRIVRLYYLPFLYVLAQTLFFRDTPPTPELTGPLWSLLAGVGSLGLLVRGWRRARKAGDEPLVSRHLTLLAGLVIGLYLPTVVHAVREVMGVGNEKWIIHLNAAPVVVYAMCTAWALLRQNVMRADETTAIVVSYAATVLTLAAGCGLVLVGLPLFLEGRVVRTPAALAAVTAAAALTVVPLYRRVKDIIDHRFQRDRASDERITTEMNEVMRVALDGQPDEAIGRAVQALATIAPDRAELWMREPGADAFVRRGDSERMAVAGPLGDALTRRIAGGVDGLAVGLLPAEAQTELWAKGLAMAAPIFAGGELRGFAAVGRRAGGLHYRTTEQSFLSLVATQIGLALERAGDHAALGKYRLERRLGVGGMAEVFLARQRGLGGFERRVAIKRPLPHATDDPAYLSMFIDEAKLAAHLAHPNIVATYEVDRVGGSTYIAMELVDGESLRTLLRSMRQERRTVPLPITLTVMDALLRALAYAHTAVDGRGNRLGIVHRDVAPGNVLVSLDGRIKLADFGVARSTARLQVTQTGVVKGTLAYMPPEQASAGTVDARSDLFAAGAILRECLCGAPPYPDGPPAAPAAPARSGVAPTLDAVLGRALAWSPAERYPDADAMRRALLEAAAPTVPASADEIAAWVRAHRSGQAELDKLREAVTDPDFRRPPSQRA